MNMRTTTGKKILAVLLVVMVMSMVPTPVAAADDYAAEVTIGNTTTPYGDLASAFNAVPYGCE